MEKVIELLKDLSGKVTAEGKKDAAQYDKYACFCKEQASDKLYAIENSDAKIKDLNAEIKALNAVIAELNSQIAKLSKKITNLEKEIKDKTEKRDKEHEKYLAKAQDMDEAIGACAAAIEALKDSKKEIKDGKVDLAQLTSGVVPVLAQTSTKALALLSKIHDKAAPKFEYQSNDIIATLEDLLAEFKRMKKDLDVEEFDINSAFEKDKLGLTNEKKFAEKEKAEKEALEQAKQEALETAKTDRDEETDDRNADQEFLDVLTQECQDKAEQFDQRSSTRAGELKALSEATAELEKGAVPNFSANKKLVGLQKAAVLSKTTVKSSKAVSFVQISNVEHQQSKKGASLQRVRSFLDDAADRTGSRVLSAIAVRVKVAEDHFVKVRGLIQDLIDKLKEDAKAEAKTKGVCDTGMANAINDRDDANAKIEAANAKITVETARKNALEEEIDTLNKQIAELKKALLEATELRAEEKAENEKTITMAEDGAKACNTALDVLKTFYENAFVQTNYVPPNSDRDGNTVGDLAPEVFDKNYHGAQAESTGIIGIIEVLISDFDRTVEKTEKDEKESQDAFDTFEKETNEDVVKKNTRIEAAEGELSDAKANILAGEQALSDAKELLESAAEALVALEEMCVKGEETWKERTDKRMEEIEALKQALTILEDWQN